MIEAAAGFSEIGARPSNEDRYAFWWAGGAFFAAVADGLGGMGGGDYASSYAIDHLRGRAVEPGMAAGDLADLAIEIHHGIRQQQKQHPDHYAMATTLTTICVTGEKLAAAHCGDTRLLVARRDGIVQLSEDHSVAARMFRQGLLSADDFAHHPGKNLLESALGIPELPVVQKIELDVQPNDWLLIASDGAYNCLEPGDLVRIGRASRTPDRFAAACRKLVEERRPADNYTMVVARVSPSGCGGNRTAASQSREWKTGPRRSGSALPGSAALCQRGARYPPRTPSGLNVSSQSWSRRVRKVAAELAR